MAPLISIIVPVYKAEKYLNRCVESIVNQTYKNLEIILVDDESPDTCPKLCDEWVKKDKRIKVIHKENGGAASSRNIGLDNAKGDYIGFVDADDYIDLKMLELLYDSIINNNSDISMCEYYETYEQNEDKKVIKIQCEGQIVTGSDFIISKYNNYVNNVVWNKLYKKYIWKDMRFPNYLKYEDAAILPYIYEKAGSMSVVHLPLYYYRQVDGSIMHKKLDKNELVFIEIYDARLDYFKNKNKDLYNYHLYNYLFFIRRCFFGDYKNQEDKNTVYNVVKKKFRAVYRQVRKEKIHLNLKDIIASDLIYLNPKLFVKLIELKNSLTIFNFMSKKRK